MPAWVLSVLVLALSAAVLGFTGIAGPAAGVAKLAFYGFLLVFLVAVAWEFARGRRTR
ncbi:DUF1328 domain-containing protein [Phenylobacterium sp.]|uniref:DUF1328 domain-containing protein n=1 Tax=Phenylobacterium sp. TaxID=1871053 RepID=UPI003982DE93